MGKCFYGYSQNTTGPSYIVQWSEFKENVIASFRSLKDDSDSHDVTLASEDGNRVEAHKVILSISSPFAVSGPTEHCPIFHFPSVRSSVRHRRDLYDTSTFFYFLTVHIMKTIYFLNAYHLGW